MPNPYLAVDAHEERKNEEAEAYAIQHETLAEEIKDELLLRGYLRGEVGCNLSEVVAESYEALGPLLLKLKVACGDIGKTLDVANEILNALDGWTQEYANTCAELKLQREYDRANGVHFGRAA